MKKILFVIVILVFAPNAAEASKCKVKAVNDPVDGAIYYSPEHRLYKYVKIKKSNGDKTFLFPSQKLKEQGLMKRRIIFPTQPPE